MEVALVGRLKGVTCHPIIPSLIKVLRYFTAKDLRVAGECCQHTFLWAPLVYQILGSEQHFAPHLRKISR